MSSQIINTCNISLDVDIMFWGKMLEMFRPIEVKEIITKSSYKSCDLDQLRTWLLKKRMDELLPLVTDVMNRSVDESVVSLCLK